MLHFSDTPYEFYPAKPNRFLIWLGRELNRRRSLPGKRHRVKTVEVRGGDHLKQIRRDAGNRLLFLPNHSTHSDPQIMLEAQRRLGRASCFMAAYDVMRRRRLQGWLMQHGGCFSVDRDGNDSKAMKEAIRILVEGDYGLTIFPEGNVYLMNDRVTPFLEGAAFIALKAQKELGADQAIFALPISIKATHLTDARDTVLEMLERLAVDMGTELDRGADLLPEMRRIGLTALEKNLRQRGLIPREMQDGDIRALLEHSAELMIAQLETKMELTPRAGETLKDRIRKIRAAVHQIRTDPGQKAHHQVAVAWADEAMTALRILSYAGNYVAESPTLDRSAESTEKLLEDVYGEILPPVGDRHVIVQINEPINLTERLEGFAKKARDAVRELTCDVETAVQAGLDGINAENAQPGGERF